MYLTLLQLRGSHGPVESGPGRWRSFQAAFFRQRAGLTKGTGGRLSTLFEWAFGPRNPKKNRVFVGQPILAAAVFQAAFSRLRASLAEGNRR
jgi:hypothetical protein